LIEVEGERCSDADRGEEGVGATIIAGCDAPPILSLVDMFSILWRCL